MEKFQKFFPWAIGILLIFNLLFLDFFWVKGGKKGKVSEETKISPLSEVIPTNNPLTVPEISGVCSASCKTYITEEISDAISNLSYPTQVPYPTSQPASLSESFLKAVFIPIGSSGSTTETSWADISGTDFYFDLANYSNVNSVLWEVSLQSYLSSNPVYIRLYDVTNKRAVDGSELNTGSSSYVYLRSGNLIIWRGENLYRIQAKSSGGNQVNFNSPKMKVTF